MTAPALLVTRVGTERFGLAIAAVREVVPVERVAAVPAVLPALLGVLPVRSRYVSLISLAALLGGSEAGAAPSAAGGWAVVVGLRGVDVALAVDEVVTVVEAAEPLGLPVTGEGAAGSAATGVVRVGDALVTVLDVDALAERALAGTAGRGGAA